MSKESIYALSIQGRRYDIGSKKGFLEATIDFSLSRKDLSEVMKEILNQH